jgi:putative exosortase-associated protein (TIGR04073 family)
MRKVAVAVTLVVLCGVGVPVFAQETQRPEAVVEKMAFKLVRGVTNVTTSIVELPKQSYLTVRARGNVGYIIGPMKGIGMTLYRAIIGTAETIFFLVPQPGYYDPIVEPEYVWQGWEGRRADAAQAREVETELPAGGKSE